MILKFTRETGQKTFQDKMYFIALHFCCEKIQSKMEQVETGENRELWASL
jgi:hypothetical protein